MRLKVSRILHAGYVFKYGGTEIAFDPLFEIPFSHNCYAFPSVEFDYKEIQNLNFSAIFISHFHDDHCSFESLHLLPRHTPIYMFCVHEEMFQLIKELGFKNVYSLDLGIPVQIGPFQITPLRALDADVDSIFHIQVAGLNILNVVDSWIDSMTLNRLQNTAPWDLVLWPFQTMRELEVLCPSRARPAPKNLPPEWLEQIKILKPRLIVPSSCQFLQESWSWYNYAFFPVSYKQFENEVLAALPSTQILRMDPSKSVLLDQITVSDSEPLAWIRLLQVQNVDYEYNPELKAPPTSEIAKNFKPLDNNLAEIVFTFLREGLSEKYRTLEPALDPYFNKTRRWRLSVFDHNGQATDFEYLVHNETLKIISEENRANPTAKFNSNNETEPPELGWLTEIPLVKIYSALELGESLTSLYIRINDRTFSKEIETEIKDADLLEDPLVRCLFSRSFASYQKAQLKKLKLLR